MKKILITLLITVTVVACTTSIKHNDVNTNPYVEVINHYRKTNNKSKLTWSPKMYHKNTIGRLDTIINIKINSNKLGHFKPKSDVDVIKEVLTYDSYVDTNNSNPFMVKIPSNSNRYTNLFDFIVTHNKMLIQKFKHTIVLGKKVDRYTYELKSDNPVGDYYINGYNIKVMVLDGKKVAKPYYKLKLNTDVKYYTYSTVLADNRLKQVISVWFSIYTLDASKSHKKIMLSDDITKVSGKIKFVGNRKFTLINFN
jgi:hypothetical protein